MQGFLGLDRFKGFTQEKHADPAPKNNPPPPPRDTRNDLPVQPQISPTSAAKNPFLHAWHDPLANLKTSSCCMEVADLNGDGDCKLLVCDHERKLKVYKGTSLSSEIALLDSPVAMNVVYTELSQPKIPSIAVAAGSHVFIYRQLRPYRKWSCPVVDLTSAEVDVWTNLKNGDVTIPQAVKILMEIRDNGSNLSSRSLDFLGMDTEIAREEFVEEMKDIPYQQQTLITCMDTLKKDSEEPDAICHLVVGTESGMVYILPIELANSNVLCKIKLPSVPVMFSSVGQFLTEWRVSVICRDGKLYTIRQGDARGTAVLSGSVIDLTSPVVAMAKQEKSLWIATMDKTVSCYSARSKRTKTIVLTEDVADLAVIAVRKAKVSHLLVVAFTNGDARLFKEGECVFTFKVDKPIIGLKFGPYGREENSLIFVHGKGALTIKIWRRTADVDHMKPPSGPPPEQDIPLPVPKKTKLYVEQTQREREQGPAMHRAFHKDLCRMRLETARAYVKTLTEGYMGTAPMGSADVRIQVQVLGLGPDFVLKITLQNAGSQPLHQARMLVTYDPALYCMGHVPESKQCSALATLLPGVKHIVEMPIKNIDAQGRGGQIMILLHHPTSASALPLLSASVKMPVSELAAQ